MHGLASMQTINALDELIKTPSPSSGMSEESERRNHPREVKDFIENEEEALNYIKPKQIFV